MADAWRRRRGRQRRRLQTGDPQDRQAGRRIPSGELRVERPSVVAPDVEAILAPERADGRQHHVVGVDEAARGAAAPLDLNDGG